MKLQRLSVGQSQSQVIVIDEISEKVGQIRDTASILTPFPPAGNYYPGLRRFITPADSKAHAYIDSLLQIAAPSLSDVFNFTDFQMLEASFSLVTFTPDRLTPNQHVPHFDDTDPNYLALLHYLGPTAGTGTAFYRHRATGIEQVTADNVQALITILKLESPSWPRGYISGSNDYFEQIGYVDSVPDRLAIYQGCLLHSAIIPPDIGLSDNPLTGRLTANVFIRGH